MGDSNEAFQALESGSLVAKGWRVQGQVIGTVRCGKSFLRAARNSSHSCRVRFPYPGEEWVRSPLLIEDTMGTTIFASFLSTAQ